MKKCFLFALFFVSPFFFGFFLKEEKEMPQIFKTFGYVSPLGLPKGSHALDVAQALYYDMARLLRKHPEIRCIVMPELSFRFALNQQKELIGLWTHNVLHEDVGLLIGACRAEQEKVYNALYFIKHGMIQAVHDKVALMPFAEYVPTLYKKFQCCNDLFLSDSSCFTPGKKTETFNLSEAIYFVPRICAEAVIARNCKLKRESNSVFFLLSFNDSIFLPNYQRLLRLWAIVTSIEKNNFCLFVGYTSAFIITPYGNTRDCLTPSC